MTGFFVQKDDRLSCPRGGRALYGYSHWGREAKVPAVKVFKKTLSPILFTETNIFRGAHLVET
jgi:hypothetical protein